MKDSDEIFFEQYKLYVQSALEISQRRNSANTYFLTINTFLFTALGGASVAGLEVLQLGWVFFISMAGIVLCYYWFRLIQSYKGLNKGKFKIIHQMEERLPVKLFKDEWDILGEDSTKYHLVTDVEMKIPWVFSALYIVLFLWSGIDAYSR